MQRTKFCRRKRRLMMILLMMTLIDTKWQLCIRIFDFPKTLSHSMLSSCRVARALIFCCPLLLAARGGGLYLCSVIDCRFLLNDPKVLLALSNSSPGTGTLATLPILGVRAVFTSPSSCSCSTTNFLWADLERLFDGSPCMEEERLSLLTAYVRLFCYS